MEHIFAQGAGCTDTVAGALLAAAPAPGSGGNADSGDLAAGAPLVLMQVSVVLSGRQVVDGALVRVVLPCQCNVQLLKSNGCE